MDGEFMRMLQTLRDEMQGPLKVSSGFRCVDQIRWFPQLEETAHIPWLKPLTF